MRDDQRRSAVQSIAMQARLFLKSDPIPRSDLGSDPERNFLPAGHSQGSVAGFDSFLDKKDSRGRTYLKDLSVALNRCLGFLQALKFYEDQKGLAFNDLKTELLSRRIGLEKEIEKFEDQGLKMRTFGSNVENVQALVRLKEDKK